MRLGDLGSVRCWSGTKEDVDGQGRARRPHQQLPPLPASIADGSGHGLRIVALFSLPRGSRLLPARSRGGGRDERGMAADGVRVKTLDEIRAEKEARRKRTHQDGEEDAAGREPTAGTMASNDDSAQASKRSRGAGGAAGESSTPPMPPPGLPGACREGRISWLCARGTSAHTQLLVLRAWCASLAGSDETPTHPGDGGGDTPVIGDYVRQDSPVAVSQNWTGDGHQMITIHQLNLLPLGQYSAPSPPDGAPAAGGGEGQPEEQHSASDADKDGSPEAQHSPRDIYMPALSGCRLGLSFTCHESIDTHTYIHMHVIRTLHPQER